jgi:DNA-binding CsgD family transcriptional regulator
VLIFLAAHKSNKEIARSLGIAANTVKVHAHKIYRLLGVRNRRQLHV